MLETGEIKKIKDMGNKRYQASTHSTFAGGLLGCTHQKGFAKAADLET